MGFEEVTTFKHSLAICGLSQKQAANYLGVSLQTVKHWSSGRNSPPKGVWEVLSDLYVHIEMAADFASVEIIDVDPRHWGSTQVDLGTDHLPEGAESAAGAIALLLAVADNINDAQ